MLSPLRIERKKELPEGTKSFLFVGSTDKFIHIEPQGKPKSLIQQWQVTPMLRLHSWSNKG